MRRQVASQPAHQTCADGSVLQAEHLAAGHPSGTARPGDVSLSHGIQVDGKGLTPGGCGYGRDSNILRANNEPRHASLSLRTSPRLVSSYRDWTMSQSSVRQVAIPTSTYPRRVTQKIARILTTVELLSRGMSHHPFDTLSHSARIASQVSADDGQPVPFETRTIKRLPRSRHLNALDRNLHANQRFPMSSVQRSIDRSRTAGTRRALRLDDDGLDMQYIVRELEIEGDPHVEIFTNHPTPPQAPNLPASKLPSTLKPPFKLFEFEQRRLRPWNVDRCCMHGRRQRSVLKPIVSGNGGRPRSRNDGLGRLMGWISEATDAAGGRGRRRTEVLKYSVLVFQSGGPSSFRGLETTVESSWVKPALRLDDDGRLHAVLVGKLEVKDRYVYIQYKRRDVLTAASTQAHVSAHDFDTFTNYPTSSDTPTHNLETPSDTGQTPEGFKRRACANLRRSLPYLVSSAEGVKPALKLDGDELGTSSS
ncbi:hypothetical protein NMY22_g17305 [Coprinellus aureogranulatus]|nr:hypothetical protein NMY22_g17305 [Coprinellus aureogranulatus]